MAECEKAYLYCSLFVYSDNQKSSISRRETQFFYFEGNMLNQLNNPLAANQVTQQNSQINPSLGGNQQPGFPGSNTGVNQVKNPANQMRPTNQMMMVMNQNQPGMNMGGQMGATNVNNPMVNNQLFNQQQANNMGKYC